MYVANGARCSMRLSVCLAVSIDVHIDVLLEGVKQELPAMRAYRVHRLVVELGEP
jgi:hypothetical protein